MKKFFISVVNVIFELIVEWSMLIVIIGSFVVLGVIWFYAPQVEPKPLPPTPPDTVFIIPPPCTVHVDWCDGPDGREICKGAW